MPLQPPSSGPGHLLPPRGRRDVSLRTAATLPASHAATPTNDAEGDKIFRILANKKKPWSYVRKPGVLYEFVGPSEAEKDIVAAQQTLAQ